MLLKQEKNYEFVIFYLTCPLCIKCHPLSALTDMFLHHVRLVNHLLLPTDHVHVLPHAVIVITPPAILGIVVENIGIFWDLAFLLLQVFLANLLPTPIHTEAPLWSGS